MEKRQAMHLWYKNAVFYAIIVEVFKDGNADGIGDFVGLTEKLDYLKDLGVDCIWLLPFYPTTGRDNGYDVTDYCAIDPRLGTMEEFENFLEEAKKRDLRVIVDLVVNHTSNEHPWFLESKKDKASKYRDYYIWTKEIPDSPQQKSAFPGIEAGVWNYDPEAEAFYFHNFYHFEPDLNIANPQVLKEIDSIISFWMNKGIDGFRMDAAALMFYKKGLDEVQVKNKIEVLEHWNTLIKQHNPEGIILAEADTPINEVGDFFGNGGRMDLLYNFLLNRYIFLSFAQKDASAIKQFLTKLPSPPFTAQWMNFLRNHDELNLDRLEKTEQEDVYQAFAPQEGMRVYNRGIRRRLAPMLGNDIRWLRVTYSLLFSLPGATMLLYGDEIGMGDDLRLPERVSVRVPMQWDTSKNGGFSPVDESGLIRAVVKDGNYRYERVNVSLQETDTISLLSHVKRLIELQKEHIIVGHGIYRTLDAHPRSIFALSYDFEGRTMIMLNNLSEQPCTVVLDELKHTTLEQFYADGHEYHTEEKAASVFIHGYGFRWFFVKTT